MIDPMAHAHMNLVGGVSRRHDGPALFLPAAHARPPDLQLQAGALQLLAPWWSACSASGWSAIILGFVEGTPIVEGRMTYEQIRAQVGLWHTIPLVTAAMIMGVGFWTFIANIFLTLRQGPAPDAPADRWLARFVGLSVFALLLGHDPGRDPDDPADPRLAGRGRRAPAGWSCPSRTRSLNMVGFAILGLVTLSTFALPRVTGRPLLSVPFAKRTLAVIASGIFATYAVFLALGLLESRALLRDVPARASRPWRDGRFPAARTRRCTCDLPSAATWSTPGWCCWRPAGSGWATSC